MTNTDAADGKFHPLDPLRLTGSFGVLASALASNPDLLLAHQATLATRYAELLRYGTNRLLFNAPAESLVPPLPGDRRFNAPAWSEYPGFDLLKQGYLLAARSAIELAEQAAATLPDAHEGRKAAFHARLVAHALAPANFLASNPQALQATVESGGQNLKRGAARLLEDLKSAGGGVVRPRTADPEAFEVGQDLALTPGRVVHQNDLMQLIQYAPSTPTVHRRPLLVVPPWINKFYVLDLRPENSVLRWLVAQGHTVFVVSWVNPGPGLAHKTFDDYLREGPLAALDAIAAATGGEEVNAVGYCLGGTLLASTLAVLAARGDRRVHSATFLTTLLDFADPGEIGVFIDDEQIGGMEAEMQRHGYFDGRSMATAFHLIRDNELIWSFCVDNYLLGKDLPAFDLLYWGMDGSHMPAAMHGWYLRNMYQHNRLREPGALVLDGTPVDLSRIRTPAYFLATREDHIAPWRSSFEGAKLLRGNVRFVLAGSGHNAGVINLPTARRTYGYQAGKIGPAVEHWEAKSVRDAGSWWTDWLQWVTPHGGGLVKARRVGKGLEEAPGSYVKVRLSS